MALLARIAVPDPLARAVSDEAWLAAMLDAERALANAGALAGVVPAHLAGPIAEACRPELYDLDELCREARAQATPVEPLVRALRARVGGEAAEYVHRGATSQDVLDTAAGLVSRRALAPILGWLGEAADSAAGLAHTHRLTPMAGRTLLRQAVPTSFGLVAAGWMQGLDRSRSRLAECDRALPVQLGGAAGTLAALGDRGPALVGLFARELGLAEPSLPWHTDRTLVAGLGSALAIAAGAAAKVGLDVALLSQTELGELAEAVAGRSSTMPQKRNPAGSTLALACARQAAGQASVLISAVPQELQRAAGAWQAEWDALTGALTYGGAAAAAIAGVLAGLEVHPDAMRANLDRTGGAVIAERLAFAMAPRLGVAQAQRTVAAAAADAAARGVPLAQALPEELDLDPELFDPAGYVGAAGELVDRALELHQRGPG